MEELQRVFVDENFRDFCYERVERSSLDEKIQVTYEYLKWLKVFPVLRPQSSKSITKAVQFRNVGNNHFQNDDYVQALRQYTKSIAFAPAQSTELAYAYGNRSLVLLKLQRFHECLQDVNRALRENCPEALQKKLIARKKNCVANFQNAVAWSKALKGSLGQHFLLGKASLDELVKSLDPDGTEPPAHQRIPPPEIDFKNKTIPNASGKIKIEMSPENKISIVATADINPGEVLAVEEPFLSGLKEELVFSHCAYCFVHIEALIHCPNCSMVMFCSTRCRENAYEKFHRIECQIFSMLMPEKENVSLLTWAAFRLVLVATKQGQKLDEMMNHPVYKFPLTNPSHSDTKSQFNSQDLSSFFHHGQFSCSNSFNDFSSGFSLNPLTPVAMWVYLLRHTSFFGENKTQNFEDRLTSRELYVASFFLRTLQYDFRALKEGFDNLSEIKERLDVRIIGHGLFPFMNLFGHSCEPNVIMFSYENKSVCRAIRPIKAGEQVFDCYDTPYYDCPKEKRIESLLERYNFECKCKPCELNWPTRDKLPSGWPKVISDTIAAKKFQEYASRFRTFNKKVNFQDLSKTENQEFLCEYASILDRRFEPPCREFIDCVALLKLSLSTAANFYHILSE